MAKQDKKSFFSEWLEKLQQESWQLELLISGLALFGIYESQDLLIEMSIYAQSNSDGLARITQNFFLAIFKVGWKIFFINLLIHVILRGLWIGAIGLRYVSQDIDYDSLNYSDYFTKLLRKRVGGFDDFIEKLEKICSVLFAYTFLLFLLFFSFAFFFFQLILLGDLINKLQGVQKITLSLALMLYLFIGVVVFIDFITLGLFKKIKDRTINRIYNAIFTFYGWTTLTFLYRPLLYNFLDNRYTKRLFYFSIPYILVILLSSSMFSNNNFVYFPSASNAQLFGNTLNKMNYEDLRQEYLNEARPSIKNRRQIIPKIILSKYMNDEDYLGIFLKMEASDYTQIQNSTDIDPYWKPGFNFSLFSSEKYEDRKLADSKEKLEIKLDSLRKIRRVLKKERRTSNDSIRVQNINAEVDSISAFITRLRDELKLEILAYEEEKQKKIITAFLDLIDLEINAKDVKNELDCYFFRYPNNDEKGLMCHYPMDSLSYGKNELYYFKEKESERENRNSITELRLPFYKVKFNNN